MPKWQCEKCGAIWHGWAAKENPICQKCGGKLKLAKEESRKPDKASKQKGK